MPFSFNLEGDVAESCSLGTDSGYFYIKYDFSGLKIFQIIIHIF